MFAGGIRFKEMKINDMNVKSFGFRRNWDYVKVNFFIMWKRLVEYKSNIWSSLVVEVIYFIVMFTFFFNIVNEVAISEWRLEDFMLYGVLIALSSSFTGFICWKNTLFDYLKSGDLNVLLMRPIRPIFGFMFYYLAPPALIMFSVDLILVFMLFQVFSFYVVNVLGFFMLFVLVMIFEVFLIYFFFSLDFIRMGSSNIVFPIYSRVHHIFEEFPSVFFRDFYIRIVLSFFPYFYYGSLLIPTLLGYEVRYFKLQITLLLGLSVVFLIGIIINWHYGLKRYEAYG